MDLLDISKLYRLPWSKNDNPNGWLEITTNCQLKCPGCYRGLAENNPKRFDEDIRSLKNQVDKFIASRKVQTISLSGGEPLLYPNLEELVRYIRSKNLKVKIFTNGIKLNENSIKKWKDLGVTEFVIHIDKNQNRAGHKTEKDLNKLRDYYCKLFRKVGDINLGFIMPITTSNFGEINVLMDFFKNNADIINLVVFTRYNADAMDDRRLKKISLKKIAESVYKKYDSQAAAYLGKKFSENKISWLFFSPLISNNKTIAYLDGNIYEKIQTRYHRLKGKYFFTIKGNRVKKKHLFNLFRASLALNLVKNTLGSPIYNQVILIIDTPAKTARGWDLCDSCPDATYYNEELVPSCLLERVKAGEKIMHQ